MKKVLKVIVIVVAAAFIAIQFRSPVRTNPASDKADSIHAQMSLPADVSQMLERSCKDCHSNRTVWPWYSRVAPFSSFVVDHVDFGRQQLNFDEWGKLDAEDRADKFEEISELVKSGAMPLPSYLYVHRGAKLSTEDAKRLSEWAASMSKELQKANESEKKK